MLRPRLMPCLLIQNKGLVKTVKFSNPKYIGDPLNVVRLFNEKFVDELIVLDIDATVEKRQPDYRLIANLANECRMPLSYGGGITSLEQIDQIICLGVEKVVLSAAAVITPKLVSDAVLRLGSQSIATIIDIKKTGLFRGYEVVIHNGRTRTGKDPVAFVNELQDRGVGEIIINSVDHDGTMKGYDLDLVDRIKNVTHTPLTVLGGAGHLDDISSLWEKHGLVGAAAGSIFVFKGKYRAVLVSYPNAFEKSKLIKKSGWSI